jgi:VIT1/CCC1 family predicted Fe2+/Mn2+ transporter
MLGKRSFADTRRKSMNQGHNTSRGGWLRAAILGADDGVVSTTSLMIGVAASSASNGAVLVAGIAGVVAGAMSMAAGEYVSVSSQRDVEEADIALERQHLADDPSAEFAELAKIYEAWGLDAELAKKVAEQLSSRDRLKAHLRDELGYRESSRARPLQAALVSAGSFASLAVLPIVTLLIVPMRLRIAAITLAGLTSLVGLGALGGHLAGAPRLRVAIRVLVGGGLAMAASAIVGHLLGVARL